MVWSNQEQQFSPPMNTAWMNGLNNNFAFRISNALYP